MNKTATFSNGHTHTYKGDRDVNAAWMLVEKETGEVRKSGFSLTAELAHKSARNSIPKCAFMPRGWQRDKAGAERIARNEGFKGYKHMLRYVERANADRAADFTIEVVVL